MLRRILSETAPLENLNSISIFSKPETSQFSWLTSIAPCFSINSKNITILTEPQQFYRYLKEGCEKACKRVVLVSLYLGTGSLEKSLIDSLTANKKFRQGELSVNILLDYMRGSRCQKNSRTMLRGLLENDTDNCNISLYHTPLLRGIVKKMTPERFNELCGLQHMKLYIFDDSLIISGANLSNDYFTNRQDRYFIINDKNICDFYCQLVSKIQLFSLKIDKYNKAMLWNSWQHCPYSGDKDKFIKTASDTIQTYINETKDNNNYNQEGHDTWIFPLIQMGQLNIYQDSETTSRLIGEAPKNSSLKMATGYFNLTNNYVETLIYDTKAKCDILMAHPEANGFLGAKGPAGGIPFGYSLIARQFRDKCSRNQQDLRITLMEYLRENWTYHGKGLWYYPTSDSYPCLTLIGSPNFGERSVRRDLETQLVIVSENDEFRKKLHEECQGLYQFGRLAEVDRKVPLWVHAFVSFFRSYF